MLTIVTAYEKSIADLTPKKMELIGEGALSETDRVGKCRGIPRAMAAAVAHSSLLYTVHYALCPGLWCSRDYQQSNQIHRDN